MTLDLDVSSKMHTTTDKSSSTGLKVAMAVQDPTSQHYEYLTWDNPVLSKVKDKKSETTGGR
jgi:hypothetical protein